MLYSEEQRAILCIRVYQLILRGQPLSIYVTLELKERESCQLRVVDALGFRKRLVGQIMLALIVQAFA